MSFYLAFAGRSHLAPQADPSVTSSVAGSNMALIVLEKQAKVTGIDKDCLSYSFCLRGCEYREFRCWWDNNPLASKIIPIKRGMASVGMQEESRSNSQ